MKKHEQNKKEIERLKKLIAQKEREKEKKRLLLNEEENQSSKKSKINTDKLNGNN